MVPTGKKQQSVYTGRARGQEGHRHHQHDSGTKALGQSQRCVLRVPWCAAVYSPRTEALSLSSLLI